MNKIKTVKIRNEDGSVSEESYSISIDARNVDMDNGKDLQYIVGEIDVDSDGNIAEQLKKTIYKSDIIDNLTTADAGKVLSANQGKVLNDAVTALDLNVKEKPYYFNTYNDMIFNTSTFKNGMKLKTMGYHFINDGGGADYVVTNVQSGTKYQVNIGTNLWVEMIIKDSVNVKQFGAYGDGVNDDTTSIQNALNYSHNIYIPDGTYMVDAVTELRPRSNTTIELSQEATLKAITNSSTHYRIFHLIDVENVEIFGGTLEGDRLTHTGTTGEWGNCIRCGGECDNIYIHDINLINPWGDGLGIVITGSIKTARIHVKNARRNGYSLGACGSYISTDDFIEDTNGTAPQCGIDIEPDHDTDILKNVVFNNLHTKNNRACGFECYFMRNNETPYDITLNNYLSEENNNAVWLETSHENKGKITFNKPIIKNSNGRGFFIRVRSTLQEIRINQPYIDTYGLTFQNSAGIEVQTSAIYQCGNIHIIEPIIIGKNPDSDNHRAIYLNSGNYKDVVCLNPINLDGNGIAYNSSDNENVRIIDNFETTKKAPSSATNAIGGTLYSHYSSKNFEALSRFRISGNVSFPIGYEMDFINDGDFGMQIYFENQYIYGITADINKTISTTEKGSYLKIKKITADGWAVLSKSGTFTTN